MFFNPGVLNSVSFCNANNVQNTNNHIFYLSDMSTKQINI